MPGKVNPVIPEAVNQVAYQIIGNDLTVTIAAEAGQLQLNAMQPVIICNVLQSMRMLTSAITVLTERCVSGIEADRARCYELLNASLALATALVPRIGYDQAALVAKTAREGGLSVVDAVVQLKLMTREEFQRLTSSKGVNPLVDPFVART